MLECSFGDDAVCDVVTARCEEENAQDVRGRREENGHR